jgi:ADP-ribose pyrophosphatase YjhB (NUDIX family)
VWLDDAVLDPVRSRYGEPRILEIELEICREERDLVVASAVARRRHHDVTFFVFAGDRLALIRKPHYTAGLWRPPGGGVHENEPFEAGVAREAREELGIPIELRRYLVGTQATFAFGDERISWATHVFEATAGGERLAPEDTEEISAARWGTIAELQGPIREALLATGRALWRYRVALHDAAADVMRTP